MLRTVLCAALLLASLVARADERLPPAVREALQRAGIPETSLAAVALPLTGWPRRWEFQAQRPMQPGSTMKLLTSVVALDRLGPNHRGFTELRSAARVQGGVLKGDLALVGGADVELGAPQLWALLTDLQLAGVKHIEGDLLVDRTRWRPARIDTGLPPFDDAPEFPYNVIPDALMLAGNLLPLAMTATDAGVAATTVPPLPGLSIESRMNLVDARCNDWDDHWKPATAQPQADGSTRLVLHGAFPRGCSVRANLQLIDRQELTERMFRAVWQQLGGTWSGRAREAAAPPGAPVLARRTGRPWGELLRPLNKTSDNAWTRVLFLELGVPAMAEQPQRTTRDLADAAVRQWLAQHGIADEGLVLDNGSGLSRSERFSPWLLAQVLKVAWNGPNAADFVMSLPTVGVDGTMRNRLKDSPAAGWARLKTGTLRNVVGLAGYIRDPDGRPWAVAMLLNHDTRSAQGRSALDALVDHFTRYGPFGTPPGPGELASGQ